ncbi:hypothetical protein ACJ3XI_05515 [Litorimonas sp. RW-G-Af-16]|uniref:hypothetical protein n=1 Tax=Litorimonas sp. RW-G-Af-16 TaxID=3241168 RepID=UPI00390C91FB
MRIFATALVALSLTACATTNNLSSNESRLDPALLGAWASGTTLEACETEQITYLSSDGVVIDMYSKDGAFHSFGKWSRIGDDLIITHNELPLDATGISAPDITLGIVKLTLTNLHVQNKKGAVRERIKCEGLTMRAHSEGSEYK